MKPITDLSALLEGLDPLLHPERLVWCSVPATDPVPRVEAFARIRESEGTTLVVTEDEAARLGLDGASPSRRIEIRVPSSLEAVGLTAAMATVLAAEGISANVVAAFHHDHVLVPEDQAEAAQAALAELTAAPAHRPAESDDEDTLALMLGWAAEHFDPGRFTGVGPGDGAVGDVAVAEVRAVQGLARYTEGFGHRPGDVGVVAEGPGGRPVGAAWARLLVGDERADEVFVDDVTAEVVLACRPSSRGRGVGDALLVGLIEAARAVGHPRLVLMVRETNPARRLYLRQGFVDVATITNRVGTASHQMVLDL